MEPVPPPPFKASKRVGEVMYALWYGRITVQRARELGAEYGLTEGSLATIIADATAPPSYWSRMEQAEPVDDRDG